MTRQQAGVSAEAVTKFRKKPVVIEAMLWTGEDNERGIQAAVKFCQPLPHAPDDPHIHTGLGYTPPDGQLYIPTLEGTMCANPGDWIIKGVKGEFYPCKPDIFEATYEPALATAPPEQAKCIGYPDCDGDLPGEPHSEKCKEKHHHSSDTNATCPICASQSQAVSAGALSALVEKWRAHRSGFVYTDATYRNCAEELEAALAVGLSAKQMPYSGSLREAIGTCAYQLEQFVRAAILTPGQKERLLEIRTRLLQDLAAAIPALAAHDQKVRAALRNLLDACLAADANEELSEFIDGSLLDAAREALAAPAASKPEAGHE